MNAHSPIIADLSATPWRRIILSEKQGIWCLVDAIDFDWLSANVWNIWHAGERNRWQLYAKRNVGTARATVRMHREIMLRADPNGYFDTAFVDHINGCTLDNRRENLRWVTEAENRANSRARGTSPTVDKVLLALLASMPQHKLKGIPF